MLVGGDTDAIGSGGARLERSSNEIEDWVSAVSEIRTQGIGGCGGSAEGGADAISRWTAAFGASASDTALEMRALALLASSTAADLERATGQNAARTAGRLGIAGGAAGVLGRRR